VPDRFAFGQRAFWRTRASLAKLQQGH
jgi:hypothetical protein